MRLVAISLLMLLAWGIEEPEPISEEEKHDEIAQAQQRAKQLACMLLTYQVTVDGVADLEDVLQSSKHARDLTLRKIKTDLLWKCTQGITNPLAQQLLLLDTIDLSNPELSNFLAIDKAALQDSTSNISPTAEQLALFEAIQFEANRTDDGFEQPPTVVDDFAPSSFGSINELGIPTPLMNIFLAAGVAAFLGLLLICKP